VAGCDGLVFEGADFQAGATEASTDVSFSTDAFVLLRTTGELETGLGSLAGGEEAATGKISVDGFIVAETPSEALGAVLMDDDTFRVLRALSLVN
jgi:hypothetical protein